MARAMTRSGAFVATDIPNLSPDYVRGVYALSERLHALPPATKRSFVKANGGTYSGPDVGSPEEAYEVGTAATVRAWDFMRHRSQG